MLTGWNVIDRNLLAVHAQRLLHECWVNMTVDFRVERHEGGRWMALRLDISTFRIKYLSRKNNRVSLVL
ncbi:hypothetical protein [Acidovorax sp. LjRoot194]|uniref:hypothetical protein n=1 Tax=Acidovorax sp. LjRoot194 TaxID=3342280 RepID=UPI003ECF48A1